MKSYHYLNNAWVEEKNLVISVFDLSVLRGFGIFDFLRTYRKKPFMLKEHLDRLFISADIIRIKIAYTKKHITSLIYTGIKKNHYSEYNIRIIVTGGVGKDSVTPGTPSFILLFNEAITYPISFYEKGVKVITYSSCRDLAQAKSLNYAISVVALQEAKKHHAVEALFIGDKGEIYEATTSNFFVIKNGVLITPKNHVLFGVTREVVLMIAKKLNIPVSKKDIYLSEIKDFKEAFLASTNKEIMPVTSIGSKKIGNGMVGEITKKLMQRFREFTES